MNNVKVPSLFGPKVADEEEAGASSSPPKVRAPPGVPKLSLGGFGGGAGSKPAESKKPKLALGGGPPPLALPAAAAEAPAAPAEPPDEGSSSAQLFLQEVAILQMQAEGWKGEWSIAMQVTGRHCHDAQSATSSDRPRASPPPPTISTSSTTTTTISPPPPPPRPLQENERLRMALYDAQSALDALPEPPEGAPAPAPASLDGQMQWRELCTSIARAADEEKAMLLEELSSVRAELERETATQAHVDREAQEAEINLNRERAAAEHWRAQHERETEAHDSVQV